jgi:hypothetical protein
VQAALRVRHDAWPARDLFPYQSVDEHRIDSFVRLLRREFRRKTGKQGIFFR